MPKTSCYLFDILWHDIVLCRAHLNRLILSFLRAACLVVLPLVLCRHILKEDVLIFLGINTITSFSDKPNCMAIASKVVWSSQAISIIRSLSSRLRETFFIAFFYTYSCNILLCSILFPIFCAS